MYLALLLDTIYFSLDKMRIYVCYVQVATSSQVRDTILVHDPDSTERCTPRDQAPGVNTIAELEKQIAEEQARLETRSRDKRDKSTAQLQIASAGSYS
ncbi:hypothetical protein BD309DRAFT_962725 [Dichomitus squalens]|nr:hypothetical protein BD309DRAFT_962725 [Dichomitus squalens]